jgi:gluconate 5-dehydrogenase
MELFDLTGRTALVTGSTRGIGYALAGGLRHAGARVVVHGRDRRGAELAADRLRGESRVAGASAESGGDVRAAAFDVTDPEAVDAGVAEIEAAWGVRRAPLVDFSLQDWNDLVATNLTSAFLVGRRVARGMVERGTGKIVNVGSVQSRLARPGIAPYSATKGGIAMLTRGMCADLGPSGIQANAIAPGYVATELTSALLEDDEFTAWLSKRTPAGRWGRVEELVGTLVFLSSAASDFVNGQVIYVDGGMTAVV